MNKTLEIILPFGKFDKQKIRRRGAQGVIQVLSTHSKPSSKHKIDGLRIFWRLFCRKRGRIAPPLEN
jgi:hypothetical protein